MQELPSLDRAVFDRRMNKQYPRRSQVDLFICFRVLSDGFERAQQVKVYPYVLQWQFMSGPDNGCSALLCGGHATFHLLVLSARCTPFSSQGERRPLVCVCTCKSPGRLNRALEV